MRPTNKLSKWLFGGLILALGLVLTPVLVSCVRDTSGDERPTNPEVGPNTLELVSYQDTGYKFKIIDLDEKPPSGFEQPDFDESDFDAGTAAFGSGGDCPLQQTVQTHWPTDSELLVRRVVEIPDDATNVRIMVSVHNDIVGAFFNGESISDSISHDECPVPDEFRIDVPQSLVKPGKNIVAFHILDRGEESFFDARVLAEISPRAEAQDVFDMAAALCKAKVIGVAIESVEKAYEKQVSEPILEDLHESEADSKTIAEVERQLTQTRGELVSTISEAFDVLLDGRTIVPELQRRLDKETWQAPGISPPSIEAFDNGFVQRPPQLTVNQSVDDIMRVGFDPGKVELEWNDVSVECFFDQEVEPAGPSGPSTEHTPPPEPANFTVDSLSYPTSAKAAGDGRSSIFTTGAEANGTIFQTPYTANVNVNATVEVSSGIRFKEFRIDASLIFRF